MRARCLRPRRLCLQRPLSATLVRSIFCPQQFGRLSRLFSQRTHYTLSRTLKLRPAPNTIKYTNCTCRILGRRNRHAGTTPRPQWFGRPSRLSILQAAASPCFFSSKVLGSAMSLPFPYGPWRSVTDEYWYVARCTDRAAEWRGGAAVPRGMRRGAGIDNCDPATFRRKVW